MFITPSFSSYSKKFYFLTLCRYIKFFAIKFRKRKNIFWAGYTIPGCLFPWIYIYIYIYIYIFFFILNIFLNVWIFILLHFVCTHSWHLTHCTALSFFATGLLKILQGYFIGIFMSSYSYSNFDVLLLL